jgi:site-specific recombinase XerD
MQEPEPHLPHLWKAELDAWSAPQSIVAAGPAAQFAWEEFFGARLRNQHTRAAYLRAVRRFMGYCQQRGLDPLAVSPGQLGRYFTGHTGSVPTKKLHLAALRGLYDVLVERHVVILNPALSVRTERHSVREGKTPMIAIPEARQLLTSIPAESVVDLRDRAILGVLIYTAVRVGAVAGLRLEDYSQEGGNWSLRFTEKGGKQRSIPVRDDLRELLDEYLLFAGCHVLPPEAALFRSADGDTGRLAPNDMTGNDLGRMVKRRLRAAGLPAQYSPHSFRSCTATDLLEQGLPLEFVQNLLNHADPRTTQLYDRRERKVARGLVDRISV